MDWWIMADLEQINEAYTLFRWALTGIGTGVFLVGLIMFFYRPRKESKPSSFAARLTALIAFGLIGCATSLYAWTWFGK